MPGVKIGDGAIISSRSLVVKDVPPYTVYGGNPAKLLKKRFDDATVAILQEIRWWDWPIEKINANLAIITAGDIGALQEAAKAA